jgi:hypothetical protein
MIKYLEINLTGKVGEDLYVENYNILIKEIKENTNIGKIISCSLIRRLDFSKIFILLHVI